MLSINSKLQFFMSICVFNLAVFLGGSLYAYSLVISYNYLCNPVKGFITRFEDMAHMEIKGTNETVVKFSTDGMNIFLTNINTLETKSANSAPRGYYTRRFISANDMSTNIYELVSLSDYQFKLYEYVVDPFTATKTERLCEYMPRSN